MIDRARIFVLLAASLVLAPRMAAGAPASASARSPIAVELTLLDRQSVWRDGLIVTRGTWHVDRVLRGEAPEIVDVTEIGGRIGDVAQFVRPGPTMPRGPHAAVELVSANEAWRLAAVLEPGAGPDLLAPLPYVRSTNKDSEPPCDGPIIEIAWPSATVPVTLDEACSADVPADACEAAVLASFQTWQAVPCAYLAFPYLGRMTDAPIGYQRLGPNLNVVKWIESDWIGSPADQGLTLATVSCSTGRLLDADILLNGQDRTYTTAPVPGSNQVDIQNAITHEAGHVSGFAHSPDPESTMFATAGPDETTKRDLTAGDVQGLCDVYPVGHEPGQDGGCGCNAGGGTHEARPLLAMVMLAILIKLSAWRGRWRKKKGAPLDGRRPVNRSG